MKNTLRLMYLIVVSLLISCTGELEENVVFCSKATKANYEKGLNGLECSVSIPGKLKVWLDSKELSNRYYKVNGNILSFNSNLIKLLNDKKKKSVNLELIVLDLSVNLILVPSEKTWLWVEKKWLFPMDTQDKIKIWHEGYSRKTNYHPEDEYFAVDMAHEDVECIGQPIFAVSNGVVVSSIDINEDHEEDFDGIDELWTYLWEHNYQKYPNKIIIDHGNGNFGHYLHIKQYSSKVSEGDVIRKGDMIGECGHNGFSTSAHLHLDMKTAVKKGESIYIALFDKDGYRISGINHSHHEASEH